MGYSFKEFAHYAEGVKTVGWNVELPGRKNCMSKGVQVGERVRNNEQTQCALEHLREIRQER